MQKTGFATTQTKNSWFLRRFGASFGSTFSIFSCKKWSNFPFSCRPPRAIKKHLKFLLTQPKVAQKRYFANASTKRPLLLRRPDITIESISSSCWKEMQTFFLFPVRPKPQPKSIWNFCQDGRSPAKNRFSCKIRKNFWSTFLVFFSLSSPQRWRCEVVL